MKKYFVLVFAACSFMSAAFCQVKMPASSPGQTIKQEVGMGTIEIIYSRPGARGRKVFGDLVPMDKLWRTGANEATKIIFSDAVEIGGKKLDSGTYVLYTIPHDESWEVIVNRGVANWGTEGYKEKEDVVRFKVPVTKQKSAVETFTIQFSDIRTERCSLNLLWEKKSIAIPINVNVKDKLKQQIDAAMLTDKKPYWEAAQYYNEYDRNLSKALDNISKAVQENPKAFWILLYKAKIQQEAGDVAGAKQTSKASLALAREAGNEDYVRMNEKLQKQLRQ